MECVDVTLGSPWHCAFGILVQVCHIAGLLHVGGSDGLCAAQGLGGWGSVCSLTLLLLLGLCTVFIQLEFKKKKEGKSISSS